MYDPHTWNDRNGIFLVRDVSEIEMKINVISKSLIANLYIYVISTISTESKVVRNETDSWASVDDCLDSHPGCVKQEVYAINECNCTA